MFAPPQLPRRLEAALRDATHEKVAVRLSALSDLARLAPNEEACAALGRALGDAIAEVRARAALALADAGVGAALPRLLEVASGDPSAHVRQMALLALGELGTPEHPGVLEVLLAAQRADAPAERFQALLALHQLGAERARQAIIEGTVDPDPEVRRLSFRVAEAEWVDQELPQLVHARARAALSDARDGVRTAAALLLGHFRDSSGKHRVLELIAGGVPDASIEDEQAAVELAGALPLREAEPLLERRAYSFLDRDPLGFHARVALAKLGNPRAIAAILRGLEAWSFHARTLSVAAAGQAGIVQARARILELGERVERSVAEAALAELDLAERALRPR